MSAASLDSALMPATYAISGGLGGLGKAAARAILDRGGNVLLTGRRPEAEAEGEVVALLSDWGVHRTRMTYRCVPQGEADVLAEMFQDVPLQGAVVSAGTPIGQGVLDLTVDVITESFNVNTLAGFLFAQAAARRMRERGSGGAIIALSSWVTRRPSVGGAAYMASKSGLESFIRSMALELAQFNIRANSVMIGIVGEAGMAARSLAQNPTLRDELENAIPLGRFGQPAEVGKLVAWLLSEDATYISGAEIRFDGAASLAPSH